MSSRSTSSREPDVTNTCVCLKTFATRAGLNQHLRRRYCKGPPISNQNNLCVTCGVSFETYMGLRQHMKAAHPATYNLELENIAEEMHSDREAKRVWTDEILLQMARIEVDFSGPFINQHLVTKFPGRTSHAIKDRRRRDDYRELVKNLRSEKENNRRGRPHTHAEDDIDQQDTEVINLSDIEDEDDAQETEPDVTIVEEQLVGPTSSGSNRIGYLWTLIGSHDDWDEVDVQFINNLKELRGKDRERVGEAMEAWLANKYPSKQSVMGKRSNKGRQNGKYRRAADRAFLYKQVQNMYKRDRKTLAKCILDDTPLSGGSTAPPLQELTEHLKNTIGTQHNDAYFSTTPRIAAPSSQSNSTIERVTVEGITPEDVDLEIKSMRQSAPGLDQITLQDVKAMNKNRLALFLNSMIHYGIIPESLKKSRTIMIHKGGDTKEASNYRPITISSIIIRTFNRILLRKITPKVNLHHNQRGFVKQDGTLLNKMALDTVIKQRRKNIKPYNIISLDIQKAFDTVSHASIRKALNRKNFDEHLIDLIMEGYSGATTRIKSGGEMGSEIRHLRGIKQGDPLSPFLFNLVFDELICKLEQSNAGITIDQDTKLASLAFADDLLLLSDNVKDMSKLIKHTTDFLSERGMLLNTNKCVSLSVSVVPGRKQLYAATTGRFYTGGNVIQPLTPGDFFKYLGTKIEWTGGTRPEIYQLSTYLNRIRKAPLKPDQKLFILRFHLLPRFLYRLQTPRTTWGLLSQFDRSVRKFARTILHLNRTCADAYIHAPVREGGLGIMSFRHSIPSIMRNRFISIINNADVVTAKLLSTEWASKFWERLEGWVRRNGSTRREINGKLSEALQESYSGNGLYQGRDCPASHSWLYWAPRQWTGGDYVKAIQLRGNLLPTMGIPSNPPDQRYCRAGCQRTESLSHVLQKCPAAHHPRIRRHDRICNTLTQMAAKKGWIVESEPRIRTQEGVLRKPDLLFLKDNEVVLCDVAVAWEGPDGLRRTHDHKVAYYGETTFVQALQTRHPSKTITITALILGARGTYPSCNATIEKKLLLTKTDIKRLTQDTINGSILVHSAFMAGT